MGATPSSDRIDTAWHRDTPLSKLHIYPAAMTQLSESSLSFAMTALPVFAFQEEFSTSGELNEFLPLSNMASISSRVLPFVSTQNSTCDSVNVENKQVDLTTYHNKEYDDIPASVDDVHLPANVLQRNRHDEHK